MKKNHNKKSFKEVCISLSRITIFVGLGYAIIATLTVGFFPPTSTLIDALKDFLVFGTVALFYASIVLLIIWIIYAIFKK